MSTRRPLETIRGAFESGQRAQNDRECHCVVFITHIQYSYTPDLCAAYGLSGSRMRHSGLHHRCRPRHPIAGSRPIRRLLPGRIRRLPPMPCPLPAAPLLCRQESVLPSLPRRHQSQRQVRRRLHRTETSEPTMEPAVLDQPHPLTSSLPANVPYPSWSRILPSFDQADNGRHRVRMDHLASLGAAQ